jgi:hypothetical protein
MSSSQELGKKATSTAILGHTIVVTKTNLGGGGGGGMPSMAEIEATITIDPNPPGTFTSSVELYSRQGNNTPVSLGSMYFKSSGGTNKEVWASTVYESVGGPPLVYIVEADLMLMTTTRVAGSAT